jgi:hypothetical protein
MAAIYLVPYHSQPGLHLGGSTGQFAVVEKAIVDGGWPYDNGDDPSFYVARRGGPLTWGVCRQNVRNAIEPGSIVVFFSFTSADRKIKYRLSAIATVADTLDRRAVYKNPLFRNHRDLYLNVLIRPVRQWWKHDENDRERRARHGDWLWRIAVHGRSKTAFESRNEKIYETDRFSDGDVEISTNYVLFSGKPDETYIAADPPEVAEAEKALHAIEVWGDDELRSLTVDEASRNLESGRNYLRIANRSGRNVHPHIRFHLPAEQASKWRRSLISVLRKG